MLLGTIGRDVVMLIIPALIVIAVAVPFGFHAHWAGVGVLLLLLSLLTASTSAISSALGITLHDIGSLAAVVTGVNLPLTLLSGILLPLSLGPGWLQVIAYANPLYYAVAAARVLAGGTIISGTVGLAFLVMIGLTTVVLWWATQTYRTAVA